MSLLPRVGYIALVPPYWTIHTKVDAQRCALQQMLAHGRLDALVVTDVTRLPDGNDEVRFGSRGMTMRRVGRAHSVWNYLLAYPSLYRGLECEIFLHRCNYVYLRKPALFDWRTVRFLKRLRRRGVKVMMEIPTFPYDAELAGKPLLAALDREARQRLPSAVDVIATFSPDDEIFGVRCVRIQNCVSSDLIPQSSSVRSGPIRMTCVAALEPWHRVDRVLNALIELWASGDTRVSCLNIVGDGAERQALERRCEDSEEARKRVVFHGPQYGDALSAVFDETDLAVGNLETHGDRGVISVQPLKHREYAMRGVPFFYCMSDPGFENAAYARRIPDGQVCLAEVIDWYDSGDFEHSTIRADAKRFDWRDQFEKVFATASDETPKV